MQNSRQILTKYPLNISKTSHKSYVEYLYNKGLGGTFSETLEEQVNIKLGEPKTNYLFDPNLIQLQRCEFPKYKPEYIR